MTFRHLVICTMLLLLSAKVSAQCNAGLTIDPKGRNFFGPVGNIILVGANCEKTVLTTSGLDFDPRFSPNEEKIVFVRRTPERKVEAGPGDFEANEIWVMDRTGSNPKKVVEGRQHKDMKLNLTGLRMPIFSNDGSQIYFHGAFAVVTDGNWVFNLNNGRVSFFSSGSIYGIVKNGPWKDHVFVGQHRYYVGGGSYDWFWLYDSNGEEIGTIGPTASYFERFYGVFKVR